MHCTTPRLRFHRLFLRQYLHHPLVGRNAFFRFMVIYLGGCFSLLSLCYVINLALEPSSVFLLQSAVVIGLLFFLNKIKIGAKKWLFAFLKPRYDYRIEWMKFSTLLSMQDSQMLPKRVIQAIGNLVESPKGLLFEWDKEGYTLKDCWNHEFPGKRLILEPCAFTHYLQQSQQAFEIALPPNSHNLMKISTVLEPFPWAWLVVPLMQDNHLHAFIILARPTREFVLDEEAQHLLSMAGRQAAISLIQEKNAQDLAIARQFEGFNRLCAFVMHDLKNVYSQLNLIQSNKERHQHNPAFIESVYQTIEYSADKINRLLLQIHNKNQALMPIDVASALQKVIHLTKHRQPVPRLDWQVDANILEVMGEEERFINVLCHLVENAQQATPAQGEVVLAVALKEGRLCITVQDTGCGMEPEFVHVSLCKPFVTTKGENGMGLGVYEAREYLREVGGRLTIETAKGQGSLFCLQFPMAIKMSQYVA